MEMEANASAPFQFMYRKNGSTESGCAIAGARHGWTKFRGGGGCVGVEQDTNAEGEGAGGIILRCFSGASSPCVLCYIKKGAMNVLMRGVRHCGSEGSGRACVCVDRGFPGRGRGEHRGDRARLRGGDEVFLGYEVMIVGLGLSIEFGVKL